MTTTILPSWMWGDPAVVVERVEQQLLVRAESKKKRAEREAARVAEDKARRQAAWAEAGRIVRDAARAEQCKRKDEHGLTPRTLLTLRRQRIRELMRTAGETKA